VTYPQYWVEDPTAKVDYSAMGVTYIEETEDFIKRIGHWEEDEVGSRVTGCERSR
jgi:hypothetical protein